MVVTQGQLRPGQDVLIIGVGGGVSSTAVQIAKLCGARVIVTSSERRQAREGAALGADVGINYATNKDWAKQVFEASGKRGVDLVIENVGAATWKDSIRSLKGGGRLVTCGSTSGTDRRNDDPARVLEAGAHHRLDDGQPEGVQRRDGAVLRRAPAAPSSTRSCRSRTAPPRRRAWPRASSSARSC